MKKNTKLLLFGSSTNVHLKNYYQLIEKSFDEIKLICLEKPDFECDYQLFNFSVKNPLKISAKVKELKKIIHEFVPDIIHAHQCNSVSYLVGKANSGKVPFVITLWGSDILVLPESNFSSKLMVKKALSFADYVTGDADLLLSAAKKIGYKGKTLNANFGIDLSFESNYTKENIIYSNRLHNELYNIEEVLKGFCEFQKENTNWRLIVAGNGLLTDSLKVLAEDILPQNAYEFVGFVSRIENEQNYKKSKIWVSVPDSDGTSVSLLESMAYGCVPVVSDIPANREWINHEFNGVINKTSIEESLNSAKLMDPDLVVERNMEILKKRATKKANFDAFVNMYQELMNNHYGA